MEHQPEPTADKEPAPATTDEPSPRAIPPAPPWSVIDHPPPWDFTPLALSSSSFPPGPPWSSVAPAPLQPSGSPPAPWTSEPSSPLRPPDTPRRPGLSALRLRPGLLSHLLCHRKSAPWSRQPFLHHGSSLHRLHRGQSPWLGSGASPIFSCSGSTLAPPSVIITLTLSSIRSSLAPPSVITSLDSVCCPPPGHPATSRTSSCLSVPALRHLLSPPSLRREVAPSGRGAICHTLLLFGLCFHRFHRLISFGH